MNSVAKIAYELVNIIIAFGMGIWFISTKGKLTNKEKPIHNFPTKWVYIAGYIGILYGTMHLINVIF